MKIDDDMQYFLTNDEEDGSRCVSKKPGTKPPDNGGSDNGSAAKYVIGALIFSAACFLLGFLLNSCSAS